MENLEQPTPQPLVEPEQQPVMRGLKVRTQVKAGGFWEDLKSLYTSSDD